MSQYLDDMNVQPYDKVVCKCNMGMFPYTPGKVYVVQPNKKVYDDNNMLSTPSVRFTLENISEYLCISF